MVPSKDSYNPNSHLSYSNKAVNDAKVPSVVSLLIKQSKMDQERVGTRVLISITGDDICLINSLLHICQGEETNLANGEKVPL